MIESIEEKLITGGMIPVQPKLRIIGLGAGVQSSVMALMGDRGDFGPKPDAAIFADTQWEPAGVYEHLDWLESQLSFPVYRVTAGNIRENEIQGKTPTSGDGNEYQFNTIPLYTEKGISHRQCTSQYKIRPILQKTRELLGLAPRQRSKEIFSEHWMGISLDEIVRMKDSRDKFVVHRFPLIEKRMERRHCIEWFAQHYPNRTLEKSSCLGCPYKRNEQWRELKMGRKEDWDDVVEFDKKIRNIDPRAKQFLHRSCKPIDEVDFRNLEDMGQLSFLDECDGMCGV
tara:strand:- start:3177 stop:4031 length:855 start_codon:yes stop_codon:yes gene_type:complete